MNHQSQKRPIEYFQGAVEDTYRDLIKVQFHLQIHWIRTRNLPYIFLKQSQRQADYGYMITCAVHKC